jgi:hypothetical protein
MSLMLQGFEGLMLGRQPRSVKKPAPRNLNKDTADRKRIVEKV